MTEKLLTTAEVAEILDQSCEAVARMRKVGDGPPFYRLGKRAVRYSRDKVLQWQADLNTFSQDYLDTGEVADLLGVHTATVVSWRKRGTGPAFVERPGRILYLRDAVTDYLEEHECLQIEDAPDEDPEESDEDGGPVDEDQDAEASA